MSDEIKEIIRGSSGKEELRPEVQAKIKELKRELLDSINSLKGKYDNNIPFSAIYEQTNIEYDLISDIILALIMEKELLGFINDGGTEQLDDDILILREKRMVDELEPEYETGYS